MGRFKGDDLEWAPVQQTVRKRRLTKREREQQRERRISAQDITLFLARNNARLYSIYTDLLQERHENRGNWIRALESIKVQTDSLQYAIKEYGLKLDE